MCWIKKTNVSFIKTYYKNKHLYAWGHNEYGQLGNGTTTFQLKPIKIILP